MFRFLLLLVAVALSGCGASVNSTSLQPPNNLANRTQVDSDGDGLTDEFERSTTKSDPRMMDTDGDGLADGEELTRKCNPVQRDTDSDGLPDGDELNVHRTSPILRDTDGDGLSDGMEVNDTRTKPLMRDSDNDGVHDGADRCPLEPGVEMYQGCMSQPK